MRHWFDGNGARDREVIVHRTKIGPTPRRKNFAGEVLVPYYYPIGRAEFVRFDPRRAKMAWKAPKIVEVPVGMEINMYACAARK
jgi:coenzyme PQQ precursor peptide PqqA